MLPISRPRLALLLPVIAAATIHAAAFDQRTPDIHYAATPQPIVNRMLALAEVTATDTVFDLGSGDGNNGWSTSRESLRVRVASLTGSHSSRAICSTPTFPPRPW
jgi:hypothetical protein